MELAWYIPVLIFFARICDVSIGTVRAVVGAGVLYVASGLGLGLLISTVSKTQQEAFVGSFILKGTGAASLCLWPQYLWLLALGAGLLWFASWRFRKAAA